MQESLRPSEPEFKPASVDSGERCPGSGPIGYRLLVGARYIRPMLVGTLGRGRSRAPYWLAWHFGSAIHFSVVWAGLGQQSKQNGRGTIRDLSRWESGDVTHV